MFPDVQDTSERRAAMSDKRRDHDVLDPIAFTRLLTFQPYSLPAESGVAFGETFLHQFQKTLENFAISIDMRGGHPP